MRRVQRLRGAVRESATRRRWLGIAFAAAIAAAPFAAALYGWEAALVTLMVALLATAYLAGETARQPSTGPADRRRMLTAAGVNVLLALLAGILLALRLR